MALNYRNEDDPQSVELAEFIAQKGVEQALRHYSGLTDETVIEEIANAYQQFDRCF